MPELARFFGLVIRMNTRGEHPPPHIHVYYNSKQASVRISDGKMIAGELSSKQLKRVSVWLEENRDEVSKMWGHYND